AKQRRRRHGQIANIVDLDLLTGIFRRKHSSTANVHRVDPTGIGGAEFPLENRRRGIGDVNDADRPDRGAVEVLYQICRASLVDHHHFMDRVMTVAVSRIDRTQQYRTKWIRKVHNMNTAAVSAAKISAI